MFNRSTPRGLPAQCLKLPALGLALLSGGVCTPAHAQWSPVLRTTYQATTGRPVGIVAADVNGDGRADPVLATTGKELVTLLANPDLTFGRESKPLIDVPSSIAVGDMNPVAPGSGGRPDILLGSLANTATILLNQPGQSGTNRWQTPSGTTTSWATNDRASSVAIVDFEDGQTNPSLLGSSGSTRQATSRTGDGSGGFPGFDSTLAASGTPEKFAFADTNADGKCEMIVLSPDAGLISIYPFVRTLCCPNPNGASLPPGGVEWGAPSFIPLIPGWSRVLAAADVVGSPAAEVLVSIPSPIGALMGPSVSAYSSADVLPVQNFTPARSTPTEDVVSIVALNASTASSGSPDVLAIATSSTNTRFIRSLSTITDAQSFQGTVVDMSDDGRVVVGTAGDTSWCWTAPSTINYLPILSGYTKTVITRISGDGAYAVGEVQTAGGAKRAFRWTNSDGVIVLPEAAGYPGVGMSATSVSLDGSVVAGTLEQNPRSGFIWTSASGSKRLPDMLAAAGIGDTGYPSVVRDIAPDGRSVICTSPSGGDASAGTNTVIRLPGHALGAAVTTIPTPPPPSSWIGPSTITPYAVRRITADGLKLVGSSDARVLTQPPQLYRNWDVVSAATLTNPTDIQIFAQGTQINGGFGDIFNLGARLNDVGLTPDVWCGRIGPIFAGIDPTPYPVPVASSFTLTEWTAISRDGSVLAGNAKGTVGGVSGTWPVRQINGAIIPLNTTFGFATACGVSLSGIYTVGSISTQDGTTAVRKSLNGETLALGDLAGGANDAVARAANNFGDVVVGVSSSWRGTEAFRWTPEKGMIGLGDLPGGAFFSDALAVSPDGGTVVGSSASARGTEAFKWTSGKGMVGLGFLNGFAPYSVANACSMDGSIIVGVSQASSTPGNLHAFRKAGAAPMESLGTLDGGQNYSDATAITPDGSVIVGSTSSGDRGVVAYRWTSATGMVDIGGLPNNGDRMVTETRAVSPDGNVIVGRGYTSGAWRAWIWTPATGVQDLNAFLAARGINLTGWLLTDARGVSDKGDFIVGEGVNGLGLTDGFIIRWLPQGEATTVSFFSRSAGAFPDQFDSAISLPGGASLVDMTAADVDGDGKRELVAAMTDGKVHIIGLQPNCPPDFNRDATLDFTDVEAFVDAFDAGLITADQNRDGFIDFDDFDQFVAQFLDGCP